MSLNSHVNNFHFTTRNFLSTARASCSCQKLEAFVKENGSSLPDWTSALLVPRMEAPCWSARKHSSRKGTYAACWACHLDRSGTGWHLSPSHLREKLKLFSPWILSAFWGYGHFRSARTCCWRVLISRLYKQSLTSILHIRVTNSRRRREKMQFEPRIAHSRDYGEFDRIIVEVQVEMIPKSFS